MDKAELVQEISNRIDKTLATKLKHKPLMDVISAYRDRFDDLPTLMGVTESSDKMARVLQRAIDEGEPLSDGEWYKALGIEAPPKGALT
jgi:hypothetical protein